MLVLFNDVTCLAVVPVFVNAGAALLPAIIAAIASVASLLFRPKMLWRACRAKPGIAAVTVFAIVAMSGAIAWWMQPPVTGAPRRKAMAVSTQPFGQHVDWAAQAVEWMREGKLAATEPPALPAGKSAAVAATIFGGGPLRNSYAGDGSPLALTPAWEFPAAGSAAADELEGAMFLSSPAVTDNVVYSGSCLLDVRGNYGTLFCLDAKTGRPRWIASSYKDSAGKEFDFKGFFSSPALSADGNYLVIGQGLHTDENCDLICINAKTGRLHWSVKTPLHIECSPAIDGDLAVAGAGAIEVGDAHKAKGHSGLVIAVKISTGEKLWEHKVVDPESSPVIADGVVYIGSGFNGNSVIALRTDTDEELKTQGLERVVWQTPTPHPATGAVTLADDLVLIGCGNGDYVFGDPHPDGAVIALDRKTGKPRWQVPMPDGVLGKIAVYDGRAIVPVRNGEVVAIDLRDSGKVLWRQQISPKAVLAGAAFTGKFVYAVSQDGYLVVLDAADGRFLEKHYLNATGKPGEMGLCVSSPTVAGGRIFVGSETGGLRCLQGKEIKP